MRPFQPTLFDAMLLAVWPLVGCSESVGSRMEVDAGRDTAAGGVGCEGTQDGLETRDEPWPRLRSFHFRMTDVVNLELRPDASAPWTIFGCDYWADGLASYHWQDETLVLAPPPGYAEFYWVDDVTFRRKVTQIHVTQAAATGEFVALVEPVEESAYTQLWSAGFACLDCCSWTTYRCDEFSWFPDDATEGLAIR